MTFEETRGEIQSCFKGIYLPDAEDMATFDDPGNWDELIPTGVASLDKWFDGGLASGLYALGGRTACGKTILLLQIADNIARSGRPVLYAALDTGRRQLQSRCISRCAYELSSECSSPRGARNSVAIPAKDIRTGRAARDDYPKHAAYARAKEFYATQVAPMMHMVTRTLAMRYAERETITGEDIRAIAEGMKARDAEGRPPVIFIDYLQILDKPSERMTTKEAVDANVMHLRMLSDDMRTPVVMISSMNRGSYAGERRLTNESPNDDWVDMFEAGFKESGNIEYTCEHILGMRVTGRDGRWTDVALHHVKCRDAERRAEPIRLSMYGPGSVFLERGEPAKATDQTWEDQDVY